MSRLPAGQIVTVKPQNNMYTVLAGVGVVALGCALAFLFMHPATSALSIFGM
jgi:hypothetical protein